MNTYISLLRGINVSGQKKMRMQDLRQLYEDLSLQNVRTYIQSGNVVFASEEKDASTLAGRIEARIEQTFGYAVPTFLYEASLLQRILDGNPFTRQIVENPTRLYVTFLYSTPSAESLGNLSAPAGITDEFSLGDGVIYLYCPNGYGTSKLSNSFFEQKLKLPATTRNWKTVQTLVRMASLPNP